MNIRGGLSNAFRTAALPVNRIRYTRHVNHLNAQGVFQPPLRSHYDIAAGPYEDDLRILNNQGGNLGPKEQVIDALCQSDREGVYTILEKSGTKVPKDAEPLLTKFLRRHTKAPENQGKHAKV